MVTSYSNCLMARLARASLSSMSPISMPRVTGMPSRTLRLVSTPASAAGTNVSSSDVSMGYLSLQVFLAGGASQGRAVSTAMRLEKTEQDFRLNERDQVVEPYVSE